MALGLKAKIIEKDLKTNLVFQNNQNGLRMLEDLKILKMVLKKQGFQTVRHKEYLEIIGTIFISQFDYES